MDSRSNPLMRFNNFGPRRRTARGLSLGHRSPFKKALSPSISVDYDRHYATSRIHLPSLPHSGTAGTPPFVRVGLDLDPFASSATLYPTFPPGPRCPRVLWWRAKPSHGPLGTQATHALHPSHPDPFSGRRP